MKIRRKKKLGNPTGLNFAWFMAATAMMQFSAAAPESVWAKEPNTEDPFDRKGAGRPDRWGRDSDNPYRPEDRWQSSEFPLGPSRIHARHWFVAQLNDKEKPIAFDIPSQPLSSALLRFGEQANVQIAYTTEDVQGVDTAGVSGMHVVEEALARLLANTGIQYRVTGSNTITLEKSGASMAPTTGVGVGSTMDQEQPAGNRSSEPQSKAVKVPEIVVKEKKERALVVDSPDGYKADVSSEAVLRFPASIQELPMSVGVVTKDSIRERRAVTQQEAIEGIAGMSKTPQFAGIQADNYIIRGFFVNSNTPGYTRDNGLAAFNNYVADPTLYERIEVIKGGASFTSGLVHAGGFVNRLLKAPQFANFVVGEAGGGSHGHYRTALDVNGVMPNLPIAGRLVFTQNEDPEFFRNTGNQRYSFLPSVRFAPREDFTLTITGNVQRLRGKGQYGTPTTTQGLIPAGIEDSFLGNDNRLKSDYRSIHAEADKKFAQGFRLKARGQYSHSTSSYRYAYGFQSGGIGPDGNFNIYGYGRDTRRESFAGEVNLTKDFSLFGNVSSVAAGMDYSTGRLAFNSAGFLSLGTGNIANPIVNVLFPPGFLDPAPNFVSDLRFNQTGAFIQGLLRPFAGTTLMVALRQNWLTQQAESGFTGGLGEQRGLNESKLTPQIGLSQRIIEGLNIYASYGESFQPNFGLVRTGELLLPQTGKTIEIGSKWESFSKKIRLTAALFRSDLDNVSSPDPVSPVLFVIGGRSQRNQGFEFQAQGDPFPQLRVNLAYTFLDTEITKSTDPTAIGQRAFNAPSHSFSAFGSYDFSEILTKGLKLGAVVYYRSQVSSSPGFGQQDVFDGYTRADLFAIYAPLPWLSFQVNLNNLADARYVEGANGYSAYNYFGAPRHVIGMVRMTF